MVLFFNMEAKQQTKNSNKKLIIIIGIIAILATITIISIALTQDSDINDTDDTDTCDDESDTSGGGWGFLIQDVSIFIKFLEEGL